MSISQLGAQTTSGFQFFTANGTFTPAFTGTVYVSLIGGGDGGVNGTTGNQSGKARFKVPVAVTQGGGVAVVCGAGGAPAGGAGAASTFGAVSSAAGMTTTHASGAMPGKVALFSPWGDGGAPNSGGQAGAVLVEW